MTTAQKWIWCGVGSVYSENFLGTYAWVDYEKGIVPIVKEFEAYKMISDLNITELDSFISSPTACYFVKDQGEVFYCDQQDCVHWAQEEKKGYIYLVYPLRSAKQKEDLKNAPREYVAKSMPEFLSRLQWECKEWQKHMDVWMASRKNLPRKEKRPST